jgi:phosphatidylserine/phosphatidylglycerophosphate/cardiolipin synthase-like enzyme
VKIYLPAWHYRARAVVQRTWGWSPIEEMILLALDRTPGTIEDVATSLGIPIQVAGSTVARLMQFGLVEVRFSPAPQLATSSVGHDFIRMGRALPERTEDREIHVSLVVEKVGHSVFRNRDVDTVPLYRVKYADPKVDFPPGGDETDDTMVARVTQFVADMLRPGEWLRGVQTINSVLERKYLAIDLNDMKSGLLPEGASQDLIRALRATIDTGILPEASDPQPSRAPTIATTIAAEQLIVGGDQHLECFERIVGQAQSDIFVLSTFVASRSGEKYTERHERVRKALEQACRRGVRCHLFYGTRLDDGRKHAIAMQELNVQLSSARRARGFVLTQRDSVGSHVKCLAADNGQGGAVVVLGSCNWLSSPFSAVETSVELTENQAAAAGLDLLRSIVSSLSSASHSIEILQFTASDLRRTRSALSLSTDVGERMPVRMTVLCAEDHERLLRKVAHEAGERFVCCTNKVGATMVPGLFNPAEIAGRRLGDVRVYYSRQSGPIKRRHVAAHRERLNGVVDLIGVQDPQVHAKFLLWDADDAVVSSMNWGSQSGSPDDPLDEIGLHLEGPGLATCLLAKFEDQLED